MDVFSSNLFLAAPEDVDKWMNILFVVVLAVFWVLRGLFRDKVKESETKSSSKEQPTRKPVQRSSERARALWEQFLEQTRHPSESPLQKSERAPVPHQSQTTISKSAVHKAAPVSSPEHLLQSKQAISSLDISPSEPDIPDIVLDTQVLPESSIKTVDSFSEVFYVFESLFDYSDPEELRKAILHYEILGKPLSLRGQSDNF